MKYIAAFVAMLTLSFMPAAYCAEDNSVAPATHEVSVEKKHLIDQLLMLTGVAKMADLFVNVYVEQMAIVIQQEQPNINPKAFSRYA